MSKLLLCSFILLGLAQLASADSINTSPPPPTIGTIDVFSTCPPAICFFQFNIGSGAVGSADFSPAGPTPLTFNFGTGDPLSWSFNGNVYYAIFGYGGYFQMTGPEGLTFTGVVTSGQAGFGGLGIAFVDVNFFGQWSNGQYADGSATDGFFVPEFYASLNEQIAPEPSSVVLLGTGIVGLWGWGRKLMQ